MSNQRNIDVSVIIVNYFSISDIKSSVSSIIDKTSLNISFEILVISNSKEDQNDIKSLKMLSESIIYLETGSNVGFGKANNIAFERARGTYLFLLNPDTELLNDVLSVFIKHHENETQIGISAPRMIDPNGAPYPSVKNEVSKLSLISLAVPFGKEFFPKKMHYDHYLPMNSGEVDIVQGSAMFLSSSLFKELGGFNESFFMYSEERDLCKRTREKGYKVYYNTNAQVLHIGGKTTSSNIEKMEFEKHLSMKKYLEIHHPNLVTWGRYCGIIGYLWRTIGAVLIFDRQKLKQFSSLLKWYAFKYE